MIAKCCTFAHDNESSELEKMTENRKPLICLLASPETSPGVLYGLFDVLSTVGMAYDDMTKGTPGEVLLDVKIVARSKEPFRCLGNFLIEPHEDINEIGFADAVVVCDMYTPIDTSPAGAYDEEIEWLRKRYASDSLMCSVCSGSALLAEAGLLNGLEVSGHWAYRHMFEKFYPEVKWQEDSVLNLTYESKRLVTCGGVTSWQDLAIYLIERFCGLDHANQTARVHLLSRHTDGQLPFAAMTQRSQSSDALIGDCQEWIASNYSVVNPVATMTEISGLTSRTFARRFKVATGYQPMDYVQGIRMERARHLLETESTSVDDISFAVGYEDPASFRRIFKRKVGLTPIRYRKKFAGITR